MEKNSYHLNVIQYIGLKGKFILDTLGRSSSNIIIDAVVYDMCDDVKIMNENNYYPIFIESVYGNQNISTVKTIDPDFLLSFCDYSETNSNCDFIPFCKKE